MTPVLLVWKVTDEDNVRIPQSISFFFLILRMTEMTAIRKRQLYKDNDAAAVMRWVCAVNCQLLAHDQ